MCDHPYIVQSLRRSASLPSESRCERCQASPSWRIRMAYAALLLAGLSCVLQTPVLAQQPASISGFLADPSGSGVGNANLTLTNQDTAVVLMTQRSDSSGNFEFPAVPA